MTFFSAQGVHVKYPIREGLLQKVTRHVHAVKDANLTLEQGQIASIVGESGCGKSSFASSLIGLTEMSEGKVTFMDQNIEFKGSSLKEYRKSVQMIFQDPYNALNPRHTIYEALAEPIKYHQKLNTTQCKEKVASLLQQVELNPDVMHRYPHSFSGGQRQRIAIARVLGLEPKLILCDEIVSALDVSVQAQILELLMKLKEERNLSLIFISHDLSVVKAISDHIYVMYAGQIVENAPNKDFYLEPLHPYSQALIDSIPTLNRNKRPICLKGEVNSIEKSGEECAFLNRCQNASENCKLDPQLSLLNNRQFKCHHPLNQSL